MIVSSRVPLGRAPIGVLDYLSGRFTYLSRDAWRERLEQGRISCNGIVCCQSSAVEGGDRIAYDMPDFEEPPADLGYTIVYEDDWMLGVNKPPNLLVHRSGKSFRSNLMYQLRCEHAPAYPHANAANRLDRETSGIVIVAKDIPTLRALHKAFAAHTVEKVYCAVVRGVLKPPEGRIERATGRCSGSRIKYRFAVDGQGAKEAQTDFRTLRRFGCEYSLVELRPRTGRTHQLRVHMSSAGHPIVGDKLYGLAEEDFLRWRAGSGGCALDLPIRRQALHCSSVAFTHPHTLKRCEISAPLAPDIQELLNRWEAAYGQ